MSKIFAIVVTYNGESYIKQCLDSLLDSDYPVQIIVVDNASSDSTVEFISQHYKTVNLIKSDHNLGFGKGNNVGIEIAIKEECDYIFLLNQDARIEKNTIKNLVEISQKYPEFGILSPIHFNGQGDQLDTNFAKYASTENTPKLLSDLLLNKIDEIYETKFVNAACWLMTRQCINEIGLFSPIFPHYGEDSDYVNRLHYNNFKVGICPCSKVYHDRNFSWEKIKYQVKRNAILDIVNLTDINTTLRSAFLLYFKISIDTITTALLFRKFKRAWVKTAVLFKVIGMINKIKKTRKINMQKFNKNEKK